MYSNFDNEDRFDWRLHVAVILFIHFITAGDVVANTGLPMIAIVGILVVAIFLVVLVYAAIRAAINKHKSKQLMEQLMNEMQKNVSANQFTDEDFWGSEKNS